MKNCFPLVWFYTFWFRRNSFVKLLITCQTKSSVSMHLAQSLSARIMNDVSWSGGKGMSSNNFVTWKLAIAARLFIFIAALKLGFEVLYSYHKIWSSKGLFIGGNSTEDTGFIDHILMCGHWAGKFILRKVGKKEYLPVQDILQGANDIIFTFAVLISGAIQDYVTNMVDAFCFIGSAIIFSICNRFTEEILKKKGDESKEARLEKYREDPPKFLKTLERMSMEYMEVCNVADAANGIFGPIFLLYILGAFPSLGGFMAID